MIIVINIIGSVVCSSVLVLRLVYFMFYIICCIFFLLSRFIGWTLETSNPLTPDL